MNTYPVGQRVRAKATFEVDGTATDPSTVKLEVRDPSGAVTDLSGDVTNPGTGNYECLFTLDSAGRWAYRWEGTGAAEAVGELAVYAVESEVS